MKKLMLLILCIGMITGILYAAGITQGNGQSTSRMREAPAFNFSTAPVSVMTSYYDYMIGGFQHQPLRVIPDLAGGGFFLTYHGQRNAVGPRRVFYAYIDAAGAVSEFNEITSMNTEEGFPALAVDPISGKPLYAWQKNVDADPQLEVQFTSDAFITGISGLFNQVQTIIDSPISVTVPNLPPVLDNEFIRSSLQIGPSPIPGKRRAYVLARNNVSHTIGPSENVVILYADFDGNMIEEGTPFSWSVTRIPELDAWNNDSDWRNPHLALSVDNLGNLYYVGYHTTVQAGTNAVVLEPDFDVFICNDYGQGTWTRVSESSQIPTWNPLATPAGTPYFTDQGGQPYANSELFWALTNSGNLNAVTDNYGRIIIPGIWALRNSDGGVWEEHHVVKSITYNPALNSFRINEIYPQKDPADMVNAAWTPWDTQEPWGVPEYQQDTFGNYALSYQTIFPFPHWDSSLHGNNMIPNYNNIKISEVNEQGMMVAVWQDSQKAKWANENGGTDYLQYIQVPEIYISVSANQGETWSEPIVLNSVNNPEFANIKPMWVYPADKVKYMGTQGEQKIGRIGLMFFNDYTWGANALVPPAHPTNNGGQVMFAELEIVFPEAEYEPTDPFGLPLVLSSSMSLMAAVMIDADPASEGDVLAAYVDVNNEPQLRGKATLISSSGITGCLMQIFTELNNEDIYFKLWVAETNEVYEVAETITSAVNGSVGSWPGNPFILHAIGSVVQEIDLHTGWNMFSLNVHSQDQFIISLFGSDYASVCAVKSQGGVHLPGNPFSTLHMLVDGDGYFVNMTNPATLMVRGYPIPVANQISLNPGWNLVAYYPQVPIPTYHALISVNDQLIQLKGENGLYEPGNPFSTLNTLVPGESYWLNMSTHADLIYPSGERFSGYAGEETQVSNTLVRKSDSQSVLIALGGYAHPGDIVQAHVGEELRGTVVVREVDGRLGALIQIFTENAGEELRFVLQSGNKKVDLEPGLVSQPGAIVGDYSENEYFVLSEGTEVAPALVTGFVNAYPNPFGASVNITLSVAKENEDIRVNIYNLRGQKVKNLIHGKQNAGTQNLMWDGMDANGRKMPAGLYFCRLESGNTKQNIKLILLK
ncbi:MAG: T9SS type A sorting domain-containing protein [bacterium]|nr:T9SS type A sorting domain-containing protein [Candidatus Cloacimonadota bacterium]MCK9335099.1 T9SS type A sorting domain-containing protein [Candidatus Cloacimonadota bacterium]MDD2328539.1 T9SS type A sorting domain-containing protein [bacterium]MDD4459972.1 T9SS type A sorting domain-containing protein [Proteiniphilum sp.]